MSQNYDDNPNKNSYEGNGWSRYQIMVLQQLEDHNEVLHNLNKEIVDIKQTMAVSETELKIWRSSAMSDLEKIKSQMTNILYDEAGVANKLKKIEGSLEHKEKSSTKTKALWAAWGAAAACIIDIILKALAIIK